MSNLYLNEAKQIVASINGLAEGQSNKKIVDNKAAFPWWNGNGVDYTTGQILRYGEDFVYKVLQPHTSQKHWTPDTAHSLYELIRVDEEIKPWQRPDGVTVPYYMIGNKCLWNGTVKESTIDYNSYSPDEYPAGWKDVTK